MDKSALVEHCIIIIKCHQVMFDSVTILTQVDNYGERVTQKPIEIVMDHTAVNRDIGIVLSSAWMPVLRLISCEVGAN